VIETPKVFPSSLTANSLVQIVKSIAKNQVKIPFLRFVDKVQQLHFIDINYLEVERGNKEKNPQNGFDDEPDVQAESQIDAVAAVLQSGKVLLLRQFHGRHRLHLHRTRFNSKLAEISKSPHI
jgi:hypothetical protein